MLYEVITDVDRGGQHKAAGRKGNTREHVKADPEPPRSLIGEVCGDTQAAEKAPLVRDDREDKVVVPFGQEVSYNFV